MAKYVYQTKIEEDIKIIELLLNRIYVVSENDNLMIHEKLEDIQTEIDELKIFV